MLRDSNEGRLRSDFAEAEHGQAGVKILRKPALQAEAPGKWNGAARSTCGRSWQRGVELPRLSAPKVILSGSRFCAHTPRGHRSIGAHHILADTRCGSLLQALLLLALGNLLEGL